MVPVWSNVSLWSVPDAYPFCVAIARVDVVPAENDVTLLLKSSVICCEVAPEGA